MRSLARPASFLCTLLFTVAASAQTSPAHSPATPDTTAPTNAELARRLDLLARELDDLKLGPVAAAPESRHGLGPAASKIYDRDHGVSIGGYGEVLYSDFASDNEAGAASGQNAQIDMLRQILYIGYKFDDRLLFNSEIEFEHGSTEHGGSVSVEFAYLDALLRREANLRAGLLLVPMGFINELHEPPVFLGARRPETERQIVPSTWRANGLGMFGEAGNGWSYRAYVVESLKASGFEASGLREGRQSGAEAVFEDIGVTGRLDWSHSGILVGGSAFHGNTAQGETTPGGVAFDAGTTIFEGHVEVRTHGARLRGLAAGARVDDAAAVNELRGLMGDGGGESVGSESWGWYAEAGYELLSQLQPESRFELVPYVRHEALDTQSEVPVGFSRDLATDRQITTAGVAFYPHPQVVVKSDYQWLRNEAKTGTDQWNVALGFLF